ncbi:hypothetical protein KUCAC02_000522, partial [Chaenocephalus aceratus]
IGTATPREVYLLQEARYRSVFHIILWAFCGHSVAPWSEVTAEREDKEVEETKFGPRELRKG